MLDIAIKQICESTDITVNYNQHKKGRSITGFSFVFKQKSVDKKINEKQIAQLSDKQILLFSSKLAHYDKFAGRYSQVGESYDEFTLRIAEELVDPKNVELYLPYLKDLGFQP